MNLKQQQRLSSKGLSCLAVHSLAMILTQPGLIQDVDLVSPKFLKMSSTVKMIPSMMSVHQIVCARLRMYAAYPTVHWTHYMNCAPQIVKILVLRTHVVQLIAIKTPPTQGVLQIVSDSLEWMKDALVLRGLFIPTVLQTVENLATRIPDVLLTATRLPLTLAVQPIASCTVVWIQDARVWKIHSAKIVPPTVFALLLRIPVASLTAK